MFAHQTPLNKDEEQDLIQMMITKAIAEDLFKLTDAQRYERKAYQVITLKKTVKNKLDFLIYYLNKILLIF